MGTTSNKHMYLVDNADIANIIPASDIYRNVRMCVEPFKELPQFHEIPAYYIIDIAKEISGLADCVYELNKDRSVFFSMEVAVLIMKCGKNIAKILGV